MLMVLLCFMEIWCRPEIFGGSNVSRVLPLRRTICV